MDLLKEEKQRNQNQEIGKKKKLVLVLLIFSIVLLIIILAIISTIPKDDGTNKLSLSIDTVNISITNNLIYEDTVGNTYISLEDVAPLIHYNYFNGEYLSYTEDKTKCYLENDNHIVGFETDSDKIYKIDINQNEEFQYFTLVSKIVEYNGKLYMEINDLRGSMQCKCNYFRKENFN